MKSRVTESSVEGRESRAGRSRGRRSKVGGRKEGNAAPSDRRLPTSLLALDSPLSTLDSSCRLCRFCVSFFSTDIGWFGLWGNEDGVAGLAIGHASAESVRKAFARRLPAELPIAEWTESDWNPELRRRLQEYALGAADDFRDVCVLLPKLTDFQRAVIDATRRIPCGATRSYGELAAEAGRPGAARAVGNVMASNRVPVIIPCHRVVASGGKWGGFSAPQGVDLKRRMLEVEAGASV
jgi:methylated-DNA-[protein]-cysteine S-methyltransferase